MRAIRKHHRRNQHPRRRTNRRFDDERSGRGASGVGWDLRFGPSRHRARNAGRHARPRDRRHTQWTAGVRSACLVEPIAVGVHAVNKADLVPGMKVAVIGAGSIGLVAAAGSEVEGPRSGRHRRPPRTSIRGGRATRSATCSGERRRHWLRRRHRRSRHRVVVVQRHRCHSPGGHNRRARRCV